VVTFLKYSLLERPEIEHWRGDPYGAESARPSARLAESTALVHGKKAVEEAGGSAGRSSGHVKSLSEASWPQVIRHPHQEAAAEDRGDSRLAFDGAPSSSGPPRARYYRAHQSMVSRFTTDAPSRASVRQVHHCPQARDLRRLCGVSPRTAARSIARS